MTGANVHNSSWSGCVIFVQMLKDDERKNIDIFIFIFTKLIATNQKTKTLLLLHDKISNT